MPDMLDWIAGAWTFLRHPLGGAMCLAGALLCIVGTIGVIRFPDFYTRLHAASVTDTSGAALVIFGMIVMAPDWLIVFKLLAMFVFLFLTSPTASHALANAAYIAGLQPKIGLAGSAFDDDGEAR